MYLFPHPELGLLDTALVKLLAVTGYSFGWRGLEECFTD